MGRFFAGLLFVALLCAGVFLETLSFSWLHEMRQMSRIPATQVHAVLPGEVNVKGTARVFNRKTVKATHSGKKCLYFHFTEEKKTKDSDGHTKWSTVRRESGHVDFDIEDETGRIRVRPGAAVDFSIKQSYRKNSGSRRYTEWRIDPQDVVTVFGFANPMPGGLAIDFHTEGDYIPIISEYGAEAERGDKALFSILGSWGGLFLISMSLIVFCQLIGIHRLLLYLGILSLIQFGLLAYFGIRLIEGDLQGAANRIERQTKSLSEQISERATSIGHKWSGDWEQLGSFNEGQLAAIPEHERIKLTRMRVDLVRGQTRTLKQFKAFPEFVVAPLMGIARPKLIPLPEADKELLSNLESEFKETELFRGKWKMLGWGLVGFGLLVGAGLTRAGVRQIKFKRCIENLPTSKTTGVVFGLAEIKGTAIEMSDSPAARGPVSGAACLHYHYLVQEKVGSGKKAKWVTREDITHTQTFLCEDEQGTIRVDPEGAELIAKHSDSRTEGRWRYSESSIRVRDEIYAIGQAQVDPITETSLYLSKPSESDFPFIVSNKSELEVMMKKALSGMVCLNIAFSAIVLAILFCTGMFGSFSPSDYLISAMVGPVLLGLVTVILHYNDLVFLRRRAERNWSNIDVSLKKRFDLVPNIEKIVSSHMAHEQEVHTELVNLRSSLGDNPTSDEAHAADYMRAEHSFATKFLALRENYPDLKASEPVTQMSRILIELENEISMMREGYNDAVETYNTRIQSVPDTFLARPCGFQEKNFLAFESAILSAPDIKLGQPPPVVAPIKPPPPRQSYHGQLESKAIRSVDPLIATAELPSSDSSTTEQPSAPAAPKAPVAPVPLPDLPADLISTAATPDGAEAVVYALILDETRFTEEESSDLRETIGTPELQDRVIALADQIKLLDSRLKLPLVDHCLPGLRAAEAGTAISDKIRKLVEYDSSISLFEYALLQVIEREDARRSGNDRPPTTQYYSTALLDREVSLIASFLSGMSANDALASEGFEAFKKATDETGLDVERIPFADCSFGEVDEAFGKLSLLDSVRRRRLVTGAKALLGSGEYTTANQSAFLRAIAERLHIGL
jgi:hypothetical protein